jgi:hypothetical protein
MSRRAQGSSTGAGMSTTDQQFSKLIMEIVNGRAADAAKQVCALHTHTHTHPTPHTQDHARRKEQVGGPMHHIIGAAIGGDSKYSQQSGMISRSYRGSGGFAKTEFDMHVPMDIPDGFTICMLLFIFISVYQQQRFVSLHCSIRRSQVTNRKCEGVAEGSSVEE